MNAELEDQIRGMASIAKPTPERMADVLAQWETYFRALDIDDAHQLEDFRAIMRARVHSGSISILAPDLAAI